MKVHTPEMKEPQIVEAHDLSFELMLSEEEIRLRVQVLGEQLKKDYEGKVPLILGVLNGSYVFTADLARAFG